MKTCPRGGPCPHVHLCEERALCTRSHAAPIDILDAPTMVHFVGFRGEEYHSAVATFGCRTLSIAAGITAPSARSPRATS